MLFYRTPTIDVLLYFATQFWSCVILWDPIFLEKSAKNSIDFRKIVQKVDVLRLKTVSNRKIMKNFDEIAYITPHRPFLVKFQIPPRPPKNRISPPSTLFCFYLPSCHLREFIEDLVHMHAATCDPIVFVTKHEDTKF